jgi:GNAT superfamily N-acetyltransferase
MIVGYIAMLAVDESHRRFGIGTRLVESVIDRMHKLGCDEVKIKILIHTNYSFLDYTRDGSFQYESAQFVQSIRFYPREETVQVLFEQWRCLQTGTL